MGRGYLAGVLSGAAVSVAALAIVLGVSAPPDRARAPSPLADAPQHTSQRDAAPREDLVVNPPAPPVLPGQEAAPAAPALVDGLDLATVPKGPKLVEAGLRVASGPWLHAPLIETARPPVPPVARDSPLRRFAAVADVPSDLPRIAIILIDDGAGPWQPEALRGFPFPISLALTPDHPAPAAAAEGFRALGFDVMAVAQVAPAVDGEKARALVRARSREVPGSVALLEAPGGPAVQRAPELARDLAEAARRAGMGLVMLPEGRNVAQTLAAQAGVPSATVFRDFDGGGEAPDVILRYLDSGVERAREAGSVILLGRLQAETISSLVRWGLELNGQKLAPVPISLVLQEAAQQGPRR